MEAYAKKFSISRQSGNEAYNRVTYSAILVFSLIDHKTSAEIPIRLYFATCAANA